MIVVLAAVAGYGCMKRAPRDSQAPGTAAPAGGADAPAAESEHKSLDMAGSGELPDDIDAIEERLARVEDELQSVGVGGSGGGESSVPVDERDRCTRVCDLAESICDLEGKICDLADRHEGEERYAKACERAQAHCKRATEACTACAG